MTTTGNIGIYRPCVFRVRSGSNQSWLVPAQHVHFSARALTLGHHKLGTHIYQPFFELFKKFISPVNNLPF